jgi:hypothetical protein
MIKLVLLKAGQSPPTKVNSTGVELSETGRPKRQTRTSKEVEIIVSSSDSVAILKVSTLLTLYEYLRMLDTQSLASRKCALVHLCYDASVCLTARHVVL